MNRLTLDDTLAAAIIGDNHVGDKLTLNVTGTITLIEAEIIDVSTVGEPRYTPGRMQMEVLVTKVVKVTS